MQTYPRKIRKQKNNGIQNKNNDLGQSVFNNCNYLLMRAFLRANDHSEKLQVKTIIFKKVLSLLNKNLNDKGYYINCFKKELSKKNFTQHPACQ